MFRQSSPGAERGYREDDGETGSGTERGEADGETGPLVRPYGGELSRHQERTVTRGRTAVCGDIGSLLVSFIIIDHQIINLIN
jgi:hypothetical protein